MFHLGVVVLTTIVSLTLSRADELVTASHRDLQAVTPSPTKRPSGSPTFRPSATPTFSPGLYVQTFVGNGATKVPAEGVPALGNPAGSPADCVFDLDDNMYYSDTNYNVIRIVYSATGLSYTFAGTAQVASNTGDGGPATSATFNRIEGLNFDPNATVMTVCDAYSYVVRRINMSTKIVTRYAGTGVTGFSGDGGQATSAQVNTPMDTLWNPNGNTYLSDRKNNRIRVISPTGVISTLFNLNGGPLTEVCAISFSLDFSTLFISSFTLNQISKINMASGAVSCVMGCDAVGGYDGDGGLAVNAHLMFYDPAEPIGLQGTGITVDDYGGLVISDAQNNVLRYIDTAGYVKTIAGYYLQPGGFLDGYAYFPGYVYPGTASLQTAAFRSNAAKMREPRAIVKDRRNVFYFMDKGSERIRALFTQGFYPTLGPTHSPTNPTARPSVEPTYQPAITERPTAKPTGLPTTRPTTRTPTGKPTTATPTGLPTLEPSAEPTLFPTEFPTTGAPFGTGSPSTATPTGTPVGTPTGDPVGTPTGTPVAPPVGTPTGAPVTPSKIPCIPRTRSPSYVPRTRSPAHTPCPTKA